MLVRKVPIDFLLAGQALIDYNTLLREFDLEMHPDPIYIIGR